MADPASAAGVPRASVGAGVAEPEAGVGAAETIAGLCDVAVGEDDVMGSGGSNRGSTGRRLPA